MYRDSIGESGRACCRGRVLESRSAGVYIPPKKLILKTTAYIDTAKDINRIARSFLVYCHTASSS